MGIKELREIEAPAGEWGASLGWDIQEKDAPSRIKGCTEPPPSLNGILVGLGFLIIIHPTPILLYLYVYLYL